MVNGAAEALRHLPYIISHFSSVIGRNEVSTTCGSGWVPKSKRPLSSYRLNLERRTHPLPQVVLTSLRQLLYEQQ